MKKSLRTVRNLTLALSAMAFYACKDDNNFDPIETNLRAKIEYSSLTPTTDYKTTFVDGSNASTVDFTEGNARLKMFQAMDNYIKGAVNNNEEISATVLSNMFANTGNAFPDSVGVNASPFNIKSAVAFSADAATKAETALYFDALFSQIAANSKFINQTGEMGKPGKIGRYLVDAKGIELAQIIQKALIGALQYDQIANVLLAEGLEADNKTEISGKNYTQLEYNWDQAYGLLTFNPIYLKGATDSDKVTSEFGLGSYIWEYNKAGYAKIYPAFLKGRAAIVNNDITEVKAQADIIKKEMEKAIASAAVGYLAKFNAATSVGAGVHPLAEGLGFIYSLRYAKVAGGDAPFSDAILVSLIGNPNGVWDLAPATVTAQSDKIKTKFAL
ncbi:DUF4856 domain-containing protein [Dyadobacter tibetensis]|uniref:DUF4856 domain-containing protein n=1 Tax=Dyadobacter tibetensis TaxID=1211851 RepID=UPI00046FFA6F|nr:DUF4856 domain-containing protein [Dyadobacter tibetensis]